MGTKIEELRTLRQESVAIPWWAAHAAIAEHDAEVAALRERAEKAERNLMAPCDRCGHGESADWRKLEADRDRLAAEVEAARVEAARLEVVHDAALDAKHAKLVEVADKLQAARAELEAIRGAGGVLTPEEVAAAIQQADPQRYMVTFADSAPEDRARYMAMASAAMACAVARVRAVLAKARAANDHLTPAGAEACLAALTSDADAVPVTKRESCHSARDGECSWKLCPQVRDGEPNRSGRHCPLDTGDAEPVAAATPTPPCPFCHRADGIADADQDGIFLDCARCGSFRVPAAAPTGTVRGTIDGAVVTIACGPGVDPAELRDVCLRAVEAWVNGKATPPPLALTPDDREALGLEVRRAWLDHARALPRPLSPGHDPAPWERLLESEREVDRVIGVHVFTLGAEAALAKLQSTEAYESTRNLDNWNNGIVVLAKLIRRSLRVEARPSLTSDARLDVMWQDMVEAAKAESAPLPPCPVSDVEIAKLHGGTTFEVSWPNVLKAIAWLVDAELSRRGGK
jgi:hypothetical protein